MQLRLTKQFSFQMAHALDAYDGKCRNLHGHNYVLYVTVEGEPIADIHSPKAGMVIDFGDLRHIVEEHVVEPFDHALVIAEGSPYNVGLPTKTVLVPFQPTSENLLLEFARRLEGCFPPNTRLHSLRLCETDTSTAELVL